MSKYESVGSAELISEMLEMSRELRSRMETLDMIDLHRISLTIDNLAQTLSYNIYANHLIQYLCQLKKEP